MRVTAGAREAGAAEDGWYRAKHPKVGSAPAVVGLLLPHGCVAQPAAHPPCSQAHGAGSGGVSQTPGLHWHQVSKGCFWGNRRSSSFWVRPTEGQHPQKQRRR